MSKTQSPDTSRRRVVVGNGMVGQRFVDDLLASDSEWQITVVGEEPVVAYDRVTLSSYVDGAPLSGRVLVAVPEMSPA